MNFFKLAILPTSAVLLFAVASPAFADVNPSVTQMLNAINVSGTTSNTTTVNYTAANATGNAAFNAAAGTANQQSNILSLQNGTAPTGTTTNLQQTSAQSGAIADYAGQTSTIGGTTAQNAVGNTGVNAAAGQGNQQLNTLVQTNAPTTFVVNGPVAAPSGPFGNAQNGGGGLGSTGASVTETIGALSAVGGHAGSNATGIASFHSAAGALNEQMNASYLSNLANARNGAQPSSLDPTLTQSLGLNGTGPGGSGPAPLQLQVGPRFDRGQYVSTIDGSALQGVKGIGAASSAAGIANEQANTSTVVQGVGGSNPDALSQNVSQLTLGRPSNVRQANVSGTSTIGGNAAAGLSGIGALNSTTGIQNGQSNASLIVSAPGGSNPSGQTSATQTANPPPSQEVDSATVTQEFGPHTASIGGNAGAGGHGVFGFNSSAGALNLQSNESIFVKGAGATTALQGISQGIDGGENVPPIIAPSSVVQNGGNLTLESGIGGSAGNATKGVAGYNAAAGAVNLQSNNVLLVTGDTSASSPSSPSVVQQIGTPAMGFVSAVTPTVTQRAVNSSAHIDGQAFANSTGIVNANAASGTLNQQGNISLLATSELASSTPMTTQTISGLTVDVPVAGTNTAAIGGSAFSGVNGTASANVAAGVGIQQSNVTQIVKPGLSF